MANKLYFKSHQGTGRDAVFADRLVDAWLIEKAPDIDTWSADECLEHLNTWGIDEDAYPDEDPDTHADDRRRPPENESPEELLARVRGLCWLHLAETREQFHMDIIAIVDTETLADRILAMCNGELPSIKDPTRQYLCEVIGEDAAAKPRTYRVEAPCKEIAQLLAFAADGGMSPDPPETTGVIDWAGHLALAQMYSSVQETKF